MAAGTAGSELVAKAEAGPDPPFQTENRPKTWSITSDQQASGTRRDARGAGQDAPRRRRR